jgi:hypothetical protein
MGSIGWLALADLHVGTAGGATLWPHVEEELRRDLERVHKHAGPFDFVLCAGDLVQTGTREELAALTDRLDGILQHLAALGSRPAVLAVPGNHDLATPDDRSPAVRRLLNWSHDPELRANLFWHETEGAPFRDAVASAFAEFSRWSRAWNEEHPLPAAWSREDAGLLPGDFAASVRSDNVSIGVVGLSSAFLTLAPNVPRGSMALHPLQLQKLVGDPRTWTAQHDFCLLVTHHPPDWLTPDALPLYQGAIFRPEWFSAHFCGHMHEPQAVPSQPGGQANRLFQCPSFLGFEHWIDAHGDGIPRAHGYHAVRLSVDAERRGTLRIWPRVVQPNKAHAAAAPSLTRSSPRLPPGTPARYRLIPNHNDFDLDEDGSFVVDLGARSPIASARSIHLPSLRPSAMPSPAPGASSSSHADAREHAAPAMTAKDVPLPSDDLPTAESEEAPEPPGLGYNARWYVPNEAKEQLILGTLRHPGAPVVVTAPPFSGKSTVLQRIVARLRDEHRARRERNLVLLLDLGSLGDGVLNDPAAFFLELGTMIIDGYRRAAREAGAEVPGESDTWVARAWQRPGAPEARLTSLLERRVLSAQHERMVLAIDRADRFVGRAAGDPMARMLRQWVRAGALGDPAWVPFRLALAAAGSALYFYAPDAVSELFASATHVRIESFGLPDVRHMAKLYGSRWTDEELTRLVELVDGQPYLCRMILFLERTGVPKTELLDVDRLKIEHCATVLRQVWLRVAEQPDLRKPLCLLLRDPTTKLTTDEYHRLYQAGLVRRVDGTYCVPNQLVASYFKEQC